MKKVLLMIVLLLGMCNVSLNAQERRRQVESDGFVWYEVYNRKYQKNCYGALDRNGKTIIPTGVCHISYRTENGFNYFKVGRIYDDELYFSIYKTDGSLVFPWSRKYNGYIFYKSDETGRYYIVGKECGEVGKIYYKGICDVDGREIIAPNYYEDITRRKEDGIVFYYVKRNGKEGVCDASGTKIIAPQYENLFYGSDHTFHYKNSNGEYVNTGIPLNGGASYASSSSSSSSSSSIVSSSSLSTQPAWLHRGWYYQSTDGIDINTGSRMSQLGGPVGTTKMQFTVYDDHLEAATEADVKKGNALKISFSGIENGWRVYRSVSGSGQWRMNERYYVSSNYDIKYIMNTSEFPIVKENESLSSYQRISSGNSGGYSSSGSYGSGTSSRTTSSSSNVSRTDCPNCDKGRRIYESTVPYSGTQVRYSTCSECGLRYMSSHRTHRHDRCNTCHGSGYLD